MSQDETNHAGDLWKVYQARSKIPVVMFDGLTQVIKDLSFVPHGICSQNSSSFITSVLKEHFVDDCFHHPSIIGYDDVPYDHQKPQHHAFILCLEKMKLVATEGTILYIGDHEQDVQFARNAQHALQEKGITNIKIVSIMANYEYRAEIDHWEIQPDYQADKVTDLISFASNFSGDFATTSGTRFNINVEQP